MGKINNLSMYKLSDFLEQIDSFRDDIIMFKGNPPLTQDSICVVVHDANSSVVFDELCSQGFGDELDIALIIEMKIIARKKLDNVTIEHLLKALNHYLSYDAFYFFDEEI